MERHTSHTKLGLVILVVGLQTTAFGLIEVFAFLVDTILGIIFGQVVGLIVEIICYVSW